MTPDAKREAVAHACLEHGVSQRCTAPAGNCEANAERGRATY